MLDKEQLSDWLRRIDRGVLPSLNRSQLRSLIIAADRDVLRSGSENNKNQPEEMLLRSINAAETGAFPNDRTSVASDTHLRSGPHLRGRDADGGGSPWSSAPERAPYRVMNYPTQAAWAALGGVKW